MANGFPNQYRSAMDQSIQNNIPFLNIHDHPEYLDDEGFLTDTHQHYQPKSMMELQDNGLLLQNFAPSLHETETTETVGSVNPEQSLWPLPDMPSSLDTNLIHSMACNVHLTQETDTIHYEEDNSPNHWRTSNFLPSFQARHPLPNSVPVLACQHEVLADSQTPTVTQKRRRPTNWLEGEENPPYVDVRVALKLIFENKPNPGVGEFERMASELGCSFGFIYDSFCRHRNRGITNSMRRNDITIVDPSASPSQSPNKSITPATEDLIPVSHLEHTPSFEYRAKRARSCENSYFEAQPLPLDGVRNKSNYCPDCNRPFNRQADLRRHQRIHGPGTFRCTFPGCGKSFNRKDKLDDHRKRKHNDSSSSKKHEQKEDKSRGGPDRGDTHGPRDSMGGAGKSQSSNRSQNSTTSESSSSSEQGGSSYIQQNFASKLEGFWSVSYSSSFVRDPMRFAAAEIIRKLGQGGFGSVYEVAINSRDGLRDRQCFACKTITIPKIRREEAVERIRNEIGILQIIDHPHIVKLASAFMSQDRVFINTLPVADCNLKVFLNQQNLPISTRLKEEIWEGVGGVASALAYLHQYNTGGGLHGDLKPENILVIRNSQRSPPMKFILADFGSAVLPSLTSRRCAKQALTLKFCAPEWFEIDGEKGPPSDIWSFGCILVLIVTYLHDKTMIDFDAFRSHNMKPKKDWTYYESLPVVNTWLRLLSLDYGHPARSIIRKHHIQMITEMLMPNPKRRPSAANIITMFSANDKANSQEIDKASREAAILQSQNRSRYKLAGFDAGVKLDSIKLEDSEELPNKEFRMVLLITNARSSTKGVTDCLKTTKTTEIFNGKARMMSTPCNGPLSSGSGHISRFPIQILTITDVGNSIISSSQTRSLSGQSSSQRSLLDGRLIELFGDRLSSTQRKYPILQGQVRKASIIENLGTPLPDIGKFSNPKLNQSVVFSRLHKSAQGLSCRSQLLPPEKEGHTKGIRTIRACWKCRFSKARCSDGSPCDRCLKPSLPARVCYRAPLRSYTNFFCPNFAFERFSESAIHTHVDKISFTENQFEVKVSSGPTYPAITLTVTEFVTCSPYFLKTPYIKDGSSNDHSTFSCFPIGLCGAEARRLRYLCLEHITSIVSQPRNSGEFIFGDTSAISWRIFEVINSYRNSSKENNQRTILNQAVMLNAMLYFINHTIIFKDESAKKAVEHLRNPRQHQISLTLFPPLLSQQIKHGMLALFNNTLIEVLEHLERLWLGPRAKSSWATSLCVNLILCMCAEQVQVAVDATVITALLKDPSCRLSRISSCRHLDNEVYMVLVDLFHMAYKTHKAKLGNGGIGFNPFLNGLLVNEKEGITQQMVDLVNEIKGIMAIHGDEMQEKSANPPFDDGPDLLSQHMAFRKRNSGRLVSKFLRTFL